ncbi:Biotin carboxyl carrier protein of acetyl-CoA carboxylase [Nymphaea thermarum]|nr:Biotin carboxyl carrier protein of acetyl-CoA carboxylase [Nymphaea thermarum]
MASIAKASKEVMEIKPDKKEKMMFPSSSEVQSLVSDICTTSIVEFELKLSGFRLYIARDISGKSNPSSTTATSDVSVSRISTGNLDSNGATPSAALAVLEREPPAGNAPRLLERAADEGLILLKSPKVGYFRRSRTIKGKRAPPACNEALWLKHGYKKQVVKEGQAVCFVEQLGGEIPVESEVAGEVIEILRKDGEAVGYGDPLIAVLPSFPGIKKLQ